MLAMPQDTVVSIPALKIVEELFSTYPSLFQNFIQEAFGNIFEHAQYVESHIEDRPENIFS
jgi:hypothetical protein